MPKFIFDVNKQYGYIQSDFLDNIREHFSIENPIKHLNKFKFKKYIPARKYVITPAGRFDIGLLGEIIKYITSLQIPAEVIITDKLKKLYEPSYDINHISELNMEPRDYQKETVLACLNRGRGTVILATAGGKTLIMALLIKTIRDCFDSKTLIIVPTIQLVEQTYLDFIEYGIDPNIICKWSGDNKLNNNAKIIIANISILHSKNTDNTVLNEVKLLLIDECHTLKKDNEFNNILSFINTPNIFGFTGTMPECKLDQWNVIGKIGPVLYEKSSSELRNEKYIANVVIKVIKLFYKNPPKFKRETEDPNELYEKENNFLYDNEYRNKILAKLCNKLDNNTLILVDRIAHGEALFKSISGLSPNKKIYFIRGEVETADREKVRELIENNNDVICIAISKIFSTGINIKNLHYIIFALAGKAKVRIIQSIGRGLRLHEDKIKLVIFDIADMLEYGIKHFYKRVILYENEKISYEVTEIKES